MDVTVEHAQVIVAQHLGSPVEISSLTRLDKRRFKSVRTYTIHAVDKASGTRSYILEVFLAQPPWTINPTTTKTILSMIAERSSIPIPSILVEDESKTAVPFSYLLLTQPESVSIPEELDVRNQLRLGTFLKQLHAIDNDWFGPPGNPSDVISWQEAFTALLDALLQLVEHEEKWMQGELMESLRRSLSRAIGFYLFDDVEVPSLVWVTGDESSVMVQEGGDRELSALFGFSFALWGDPLMEALFMNPSRAILEGYEETLIVFQRQRTKRTWYTLFFALLVIVESEDEDRLGQARSIVEKCVDNLKTAPCY